jgi:single-strand DNA-binding protein
MGNLTRDVELKFTTKGTAVAQMGLAINETYTQDNEKKERVTFVDVTVFGKQAEHCGNYLSKGKLCLIQGRLQLDQWDDKESGQKRSKLKVVAERVQFLSPASGGRDDQRDPRSEAAGESQTGDNIPY